MTHHDSLQIHGQIHAFQNGVCRIGRGRPPPRKARPSAPLSPDQLPILPFEAGSEQTVAQPAEWDGKRRREQRINLSKPYLYWRASRLQLVWPCHKAQVRERLAGACQKDRPLQVSERKKSEGECTLRKRKEEIIGNTIPP